MTQLHETIYRLRTTRGLSQEELARQLEVSRQSVSKWETGGSVPDLDKLVRMADLFGVTLDALVRSGDDAAAGDAPQASRSHDTTAPAAVPEMTAYTAPKTDTDAPEQPWPRRKTAGCILFGCAALILLFFAAMGAPGGGLLFSLPFLLCGAVCFLFRCNVGLWCCWALMLLLDLYLRWATGLTYRFTSLTGVFTPEMNYTRLLIAWLQLLLPLGLAAVTVFRFRRKAAPLSRAALWRLPACWGGFAVLCLPLSLLVQRTYGTTAVFAVMQQTAFTLLQGLLDWLRLGLLCAAVIHTIAFLRSRKQQ